MDDDFITEARSQSREVRLLICAEAILRDATVKPRHLRKALKLSGRQFRKARRHAQRLAAAA
jgi:hypothetical protein